MRPNRYSEYASYIVMAYNSNLNANYDAFVRYKEVVAFLNQIANN